MAERRTGGAPDAQRLSAACGLGQPSFAVVAEFHQTQVAEQFEVRVAPSAHRPESGQRAVRVAAHHASAEEHRLARHGGAHLLVQRLQFVQRPLHGLRHGLQQGERQVPHQHLLDAREQAAPPSPAHLVERLLHRLLHPARPVPHAQPRPGDERVGHGVRDQLQPGPRVSQLPARAVDVGRERPGGLGGAGRDAAGPAARLDPAGGRQRPVPVPLQIRAHHGVVQPGGAAPRPRTAVPEHGGQGAGQVRVRGRVPEQVQGPYAVRTGRQDVRQPRAAARGPGQQPEFRRRGEWPGPGPGAGGGRPAGCLRTRTGRHRAECVRTDERPEAGHGGRALHPGTGPGTGVDAARRQPMLVQRRQRPHPGDVLQPVPVLFGGGRGQAGGQRFAQGQRTGVIGVAQAQLGGLAQYAGGAAVVRWQAAERRGVGAHRPRPV